MTLSGACLAMAVLFLLARLIGADVMPARGWQSADIAPMLVYAIASLAISQYFWIASVDRLGVALASFHLNTAPFYVMLIMLGFGAQWSWTQAAGALIVGFGVVIAQRR